jgi:hypothetical protein
MNILTRKIINPNIVIHDTDTSYHPLHASSEEDSKFTIVRTTNYTQLCALIDKWKILLLEKYDAKPGQTVFIQGHPSADYYGAIIATWELGLVNVLDMPRIRSKEEVDGTKTKLFGVNDFVIQTNSEEDIYGAQVTGIGVRWLARPTFMHEAERDRNQSRHIITPEIFSSYVVQDPEKYTNIADVILCTPKSNLIKFPSSGTTGDPKLLTMSHKNVVIMARRYIPYTNCIAEDNALHTNNLNHGSTLMIHWLPSFMICDNHYTANSGNLIALIKFADEVGINRTILYTTKLLTDWLLHSKPLDRPMHIMTLFQITDDMIKTAQEKHITIYGLFGSSDIGGFFFSKVIDSNFDPSNYDVSWVGTPADDFWNFEIRDNVLWISCPTLDIDWCTANDQFKVVDNNYYFLGRSDLYRIGETWFKLADLEYMVLTTLGDSANIAIDIDLQKIYLVIWQDSESNESKFHLQFKLAYPNLSIDYVLRDQAKDRFSSGRKVDNSLIRDYCRKKLGLTK